MTGVRRRPFSAADAEEVVAFAGANGSPFDAGVVRRLTVDLTSDPEGVFLIEGERGLLFVGVVPDRVETGVGAAMMEILGVAAAVGREAFARLVVEPAVAFARRGKRRALHVPLNPLAGRIEAAEAVLVEAGFGPGYESFIMWRPADAPAAGPPDPLPDGWRWAALDAELELLGAAHAMLAEAFREAPSFGLGPLPSFQLSVASGATTWRAIVDGTSDGGVVAGLVQVVGHGEAGEIRTVARAPAYRGRGLGPRLVAQGLGLLLGHGPRAIELSVEAANDRALALYRRFGFEVTTRVPVLSLEFGRG